MNILYGISMLIAACVIVFIAAVSCIQLLNWLDERKFICRRCKHCDMIKGKTAACNMLVEDVSEITYCCLYEKRGREMRHHDNEIS